MKYLPNTCHHTQKSSIPHKQMWPYLWKNLPSHTKANHCIHTLPLHTNTILQKTCHPISRLAISINLWAISSASSHTLYHMTLWTFVICTKCHLQHSEICSPYTILRDILKFCNLYKSVVQILYCVTLWNFVITKSVSLANVLPNSKNCEILWNVGICTLYTHTLKCVAQF